MNIELYTKLTGITVSDAESAAVTAQIRKTRRKLEAMLGYSLNKKPDNQYEEKGKADRDCGLWGVRDINEDTLLPKDEVQGSYRLFPYNPKDRFFVVDPFVKVYAVKLVFVKMGDEPNGITHKTFSSSKVRVDRTGNVSKYIERCHECFCTCRCVNECVQLAVDADWLNEECLPEELLDIWADMVTYYTDCKADIQSETLGTHTYRKFDRRIPEELADNLKILRKYAGPNGTLAVTLTV